MSSVSSLSPIKAAALPTKSGDRPSTATRTSISTATEEALRLSYVLQLTVLRFDPSKSRPYSEDELLRRCLDSLQCPDTHAIKMRLKASKDKLLKEAIGWIFREQQYRQWTEGDDICLLWIKGRAGQGKTMMSIGIIEKLSYQFDSSLDESVMVTYFFCQNADYTLNTAESIVKGLLRRLVDQNRELRSPLHRLWNEAAGRPQERKLSLQELWHLFDAIVEQCESRRVYVVIDALDECQEDGLWELLTFVVRTGLDRPSKVKWLLTSRPLDAAEKTLLASHEQVRVSLDLNSAHISRAVETYVSFKASELDQRHRYGEPLRQKIEKELIGKAEGTFLWVSLVCKRLEEVSASDTLLAIRGFPPGLNALYARIFDELSSGEPGVVKGCMRLLKVMLLAYRPLNTIEVESVAGLPRDIVVDQNIAERCASFVKIQGNEVAFVHQSARDYLSGTNGVSILDSYELYGHEHIALSALDFLTRHLKVNLLGLPQPDSAWTAADTRKNSKQSIELSQMDYAATFWVRHFSNVQTSGLGDSLYINNGPIQRFLCTYFLEWMECVSLLQKLSNAVDALKQLKALADTTEVKVFY